MSNVSFYTNMLTDERAGYFKTSYNDASRDVSEELQDAINSVKGKDGYGVLFVPSGKYLISKMIMVPKAIRIIGLGEERPEFILADNAPMFNMPNPQAKGGYRYMFWFVNDIVDEMDESHDANPGTFYSAMSNINISLGYGNEYAVALRTHYAQHCFINHMTIEVQSGMAGIYDVGNEIEDVTIKGGNYGIITTKCSPGWPFVMVDTKFKGQKYAAIKTREAGLVICRCEASSTAKFVEVEDGYFEKLYIENSVFRDMNCLISMAMDANTMTQVNVNNCYLKSVENVAEYRDTNRKIPSEDYQCKLKSYIHGITVSDEYPDKQFHDQVYRYAMDLDKSVLQSDIPELPPMNSWVNAKEVGLAGDGVADDTEALKVALKMYDTIYFPQGDYIITDTIKLRENNVLIGMNPISTQLILKENSENFTGFGRMKPFIETSDGYNVMMGLGINTGGRNPRACGVKWIANEESYMNDVKFIGGHGNLVYGTGDFDSPYDEGRARDAHLERIMDYQYPSLVICDNGGGTFKDVWSASHYASAGVQIQNTSTKTKIYCLSLEHHARCEMRMINASNITVYGFQSEEEKYEGEFAQPIELHNCSDITFATTYCFRTVFVQKPFDYCVKTYNCKNIKFLNVHNYSQMKYTISNFLLDVNTGIEVRPWQAAKVTVTGKVDKKRDSNNLAAFDFDSFTDCEKLYSGFRFADGGCSDGRGNFYFLDSLDKRIYRIDGNTLDITMHFESPFKINSIGFDTRDNIIIVGEYTIPLEATKDGIKIENILPPDSAGTSYGFWYDARAIVTAFTLDENRQIVPLDKINIGDVMPERVLYAGNRWRDSTDFPQVVQYNPGKAFIAPDGATIIPCQYDLIRANNLARSKPGRKLYSIDEMYKRVYQCDITEEGLLTNPVPIIEEGDFRVRKLNDKIYVGDDNIKIYDKGKLSRTLYIPERPTTFDFGGPKRNNIFVTSAHSVYIVKE